MSDFVWKAPMCAKYAHATCSNFKGSNKETVKKYLILQEKETNKQIRVVKFANANPPTCKEYLQVQFEGLIEKIINHLLLFCNLCHQLAEVFVYFASSERSKLC